MEIGNNSLNGLGLVSDQTAKYLPEPAVTGSGLFNDVLNVVSSLGSTAIGGVPAVVNGDFASLLNAQLEASREMQSVSMVSNIEKSKHESKMAAIRNIRVS
jgi:hypothetical protein